MKNRIIIIIPFFGNWPDWINLYFKSCESNTIIDWYFFTDCEVPESHASNLFFNSISFTDYCELVSQKLKIEFRHTNPYKVCGLRPFYALVHHEIVKDYNFWGWGDLDVVWGDISKFYTNELLNKYEVFSTHADRVSGHLAIIKNSSYYNNLCLKIDKWEERLTDTQAIALDEQDFSWLIYPASKYLTKFYSKIIRNLFNWRNAWVLYYSTIAPFYNWLLGIKNKKLYFKEQHTTPILYDDGLTFKHDTDKWFYKNGQLINSKTNKEYIYFHFMVYKKNSFRNDHFWSDKFYFLDEHLNSSEYIVIDKSGFNYINK